MSSFAAASVENTPVGSVSLATPSNVNVVNPGIVLELIAQAETKMTALEHWRDNIHSDACLLLARIKQERLDRAIEIEDRDRELKILRERSLEAERVACLALIAREDALRLCAMANAKVVEAEEKAEAAERRAESAEGWLEKIQAAMADDFFDVLRLPSHAE